jgi:hypothetical protein
VKCRYTKYGCKEVNKLEIVKRHENNCEFKTCEDCGLANKEVHIEFKNFNFKRLKSNFLFAFFKRHNCIIELKKVIESLKSQLEKVI